MTDEQPAEKDDHDVLVWYHNRVTKKILSFDSSCFEDEYDPSDTTRAYVAAYASDEADLLGYILFSDDGLGGLHVDRVCVKEKTRGLGLAKRLVECVMRYAKVQKLHHCRTYIHAANAASINTFMSLGWRVYTEPDVADEWLRLRHICG